MKRNKSGQGLVEYVLIIGLISLVCIAIMTSMGGTISGSFYGNISSNLDEVTARVTK